MCEVSVRIRVGVLVFEIKICYTLLMNTCSVCKERVESFADKKKCRACYNSYMNDYMKRRYEKRRNLAVHMLGGACVDCGSKASLEFDHQDSSTKEFNIAKLFSSASNIKLQKELSKCVLRCTSCHLEKSRRMRDTKYVEHGEGLTGKYNCRCDLCGPLKNAYMREWRAK